MTETPSTPSFSAILREADGFARRLGPGAGVDRHAAVDVRHGGGDHLLLLALVQGVELAVGAQDEDAVHAGSRSGGR